MYETILHFEECRKILKNTISFLSGEAIPLTQKHFLKKTTICFLIKVQPFSRKHKDFTKTDGLQLKKIMNNIYLTLKHLPRMMQKNSDIIKLY